MTPKHRIALQLGIIGTTLWLMAGCFYLPTPNKAVDGSSLPRDLIGGVDSGKPLAVHRSTRDDANRVLPNVLMWSPDRRYAIYTYTVRTGYTVWPLCFAASADTDLRFLQLRFSPEGRLEGFDSFDEWEWATRDTGIMMRTPYVMPVPRQASTPLTPEQESVVRGQLASRHRAETRPTTAPKFR